MGISVYRRAPIIDHLLFADDSLLFCKATVDASNNLLKIIDEYAQVSSQCINADKTTMIFSQNVREVDKIAISVMWGYKDTKQYDKYLGFPPLIGRSKTSIF